jgi:hypothetical protein
MDIPMELDELKLAWKTLDQRLQRQNALQLAALHERKTANIRSSLRPLFWGQCLQILFGIATVVSGVWLWKTFPAVTVVLIVGILVHLYGIATIIAGGVMLGGIARIDRSLPVLELQQRLATLRKTYIISGAVVGLPWWLLWVVPPLVLVSLQGAQTGAIGLPAWLWACLIGGALGLLGTLALHRWLHRPGREALAKRMQDSAVGGSLRRAQAELEALKRYAEE